MWDCCTGCPLAGPGELTAYAVVIFKRVVIVLAPPAIRTVAQMPLLPKPEHMPSTKLLPPPHSRRISAALLCVSLVLHPWDMFW